MHIKKLQIQGVRNLNDVTIIPTEKINIFTGKNASGKTSFLEAIYILSRSKSFRTPKIRNVINNQQNTLTVAAEVDHERLGTTQTGVEKGVGHLSIIQNGEKIKTVSDQAKAFPIVVITQETQQLISGAPKQRRHWLDWAMFHVEPGYLNHWKQYFKALRQRNILLKKGEKDEELYRAWEDVMVKSAAELTTQREVFLKAVNDRFQSLFNGDAERQDIKIEFNPGEPGNRAFSEYLDNRRQEDFQKGFTRYGPHQAEVNFTSRGESLKNHFSRGQIKLFVNQLLISQASIVKDKARIAPILLMDDHTAELDKESSEHLLSLVKEQVYQAFITTTEAYEADTESRVFHVKQGRILQ